MRLAMRRHCALSVAVLVAVGLMAVTGQAQTTPVLVRIVPASVQVAVGETVDVAVEVVDVHDLYGFDVSVVFDPQVVEVVDADPGLAGVQVAQGMFLEPGFAIVNTADNSAGVVHFVMTQLNPSEAKSGTGSLIVIRLLGKQAGTSSRLTVSDPQLAKRDGFMITAEPGSGEVSVTPGGGPTYTAMPTQGAGTPMATTTPGTPTPRATATQAPSPLPATAAPEPSALPPTSTQYPTGLPATSTANAAVPTTAATSLPAPSATAAASRTPVIPASATTNAIGEVVATETASVDPVSSVSGTASPSPHPTKLTASATPGAVAGSFGPDFPAWLIVVALGVAAVAVVAVALAVLFLSLLWRKRVNGD